LRADFLTFILAFLLYSWHFPSTSFHFTFRDSPNRGWIIMKRTIIFMLVAGMIMAAWGCSASNKTKGAAIGAGTGAVVGGVIGKQAGNTMLGAIIGAAVGGAAGAYIGNYMDKQAAEIERDIAGAKVERIGEGIKITFDSGLLFDVNKAALRPAAITNLNELAAILKKYEDTNILIEGHTDATGTDEHNLELSRQRAQSVANQLASLQVNPARFTIMGYGESQPIATNDTSEGKQQNRRVDLAIMANDKLKKAAESKAG
jgi:outer membrane protein OmpA-like peptidoglycan-associated protein